MEPDREVITLKDVARIAGVSVGTVSNVINDIGTVKPENRRRVLEAMEQLDYIPNSMARSLKTQKSPLVGLILPSIMNPFYPSLSRGVESVLQRRGFMVVQCNTERDPSREHAYLETLIANRVSGIIIAKSDLPAALLHKYSEKTNIVLIDAFPDYAGDLDVVETTNHEGIASAVRHLLALGHRKIGYITGDLKAKSDGDRLAGFRDTMAGAELQDADRYTRYGDFSSESGSRHARELLSLSDPPTAIVCSNDFMAIGVLREARAGGIAVPGALSVSGFDDIEMSALVTPALTTVSQPKYEQGELAARILSENIETGKIGEGRRMVLPTRLVVRESTAAPRE